MKTLIKKLKKVEINLSQKYGTDCLIEIALIAEVKTILVNNDIFSKKEKRLLSFLVAKDLITLKLMAKKPEELKEWETDYRNLIGKINNL